MLLAHDDVGPGPVVVLLHGFPFDRSVWSHQRKSLGAIHRLILPDLRGHGSTAAPDQDYGVDTLADDVIELLDALQLDQPVVIGGLSMGGYVALSIAARHPDRLRGLILMNTRASSDAPEAAQVRLGLANQVEASGNTGPVVDAMLPKLFARSTIEHHPEVVAAFHDRMSRTSPRAVAGTLRGLADRPDRSATLGRIEVPTLVIAGAEDRLIAPEESSTLAQAIPHARMVTIANSGHLSPLENPTATDAALLAFLEDLG